MNTITIPKNLIKEKELVLIPRREYEKFLLFHSKKEKGSELTVAQRKRLKKSRENLANGRYFTMYELKQKLGVKN